MELISESAKGSRTLVGTLDSYARYRPHKVYHSIPISPDIDHGFRDITFRDISRAVDSFAWWLVGAHGHGHDFETLAYIGVNDLRYAILFFALIKAGYKAFFISPENSASQIKYLLETTQCSKFFFSQEHQEKVEKVLDIKPDLGIEVVEPLDYWMASFSQPFIFNRPFEISKWDPILVINSADSRGFPKPVTVNNGYFAAAETDALGLVGRRPAGISLFNVTQGGHHFCPMPLWHLSGFFSAVVLPVFAFHTTNVLAPPTQPSAPVLVKKILEKKNIKLLYTRPSLVEDIAQIEGGIKQLSKLDCLIYADGPLSKECGDFLVQNGVCVCQSYGDPETGGAKTLVPNPEDWQYLEFQPSYNFSMEPVLSSGIYELVYRMPKRADETVTQANRRYRGVDWVHPDVEEYRSRDLFAPHPKKSGLWKHCGRLDDIITSSPGKKVKASEVETVPSEMPFKSSKIAGALS